MVLLLAVLGGCGGGAGVSEGATVTAYVAATLCGEARRELESHGASVGDLQVRIHCLASEGTARRLDLAAVGANARRASEDSTTVAYLQPPGRATRFSIPILEAAEIPTITASSGRTGMAELLAALRAADPSELRASLRDSLAGS